MPEKADRSAADFLRTWEHYASLIPVGMSRDIGGTRACVTGVPVPTLNGVFIATETVEPAVVTTLLDEVSSFGLPFCLQGRPASGAVLAEIARAHGMSRTDDPPLMVIHKDARPAVAVADVVVRELEPTEGNLHLEVAAAGFGAPREQIDNLAPPELLADPAIRVYASMVDGRAVSTGLAIRVQDTVGVFNVATVPEYRGRGHGTAVTARLVADAFTAGASLACLQSTAEGYPVYERLGFVAIERWLCWIAPAPVG